MKKIRSAVLFFSLTSIVVFFVFACATLNSGKTQPEITSAQWQGAEDDELKETAMRAKINLSVQTKDLKDREQVTFKIYFEGADPAKDEPLKVMKAPVKAGKARTEFEFSDIQAEVDRRTLKIDETLYRYYWEQGYHIPREEFETYSDVKGLPKYFFTASAKKCAEVKSESVEVSNTLTVTYRDARDEVKKGVKIIVTESNGTVHEKITNEKGIAYFTGLIPALKYNIDHDWRRTYNENDDEE